jgi:hypothetical protein
MAKKVKLPDGTIARYEAIKGRKSEKTKPRNLKRKPYRGQGRP